MNVIGRIVSHYKFGKGMIVEQGEKSIKIEFSTETKTMQYPNCFEKFIVFVDGEVPSEIIEDLIRMKENEEKEKEDREKRIQEIKSSSEKRLIGRPIKNGDKKISANIISIHKECWEYLIRYQQENPGFNFVPRKMNNKNRLNEGYYFIGGNNYLLISFWDGAGDNKNVTHTIDFGITDDGCAYVQLSSRDNDERAKYLKEMVRILEEKLGYRYNDDVVNYWRRFYPDNLPFIDALESFIKNEKLLIDDYVMENPLLGLTIADASINDKYIKKIMEVQSVKINQK